MIRLTGGGNRLLTAAAAVVVAAGTGFGLYQQTMAPAPIEELIPESVIAAGGGDVRWLWDVTQDLREMPDGAKAMAEVEKEMGIDFNRDVVPWAGQVGGVLLSLGKETTGAILVEVRNPIQYYKTMTRVRTMMERESTPHWKPADYYGVPLRYTHMPIEGGSRIAVSTAWLKGWVVVGIGNGATKRIIDVWQDRKRSIASNEAWTSALARLPGERISWGASNPGMLGGFLKEMGMSPEVADSMRAVSATAVTELPDGFHIDTATTATGTASRNLYSRLAQDLPPVPPALLARAPAGTFACFAFTNPGGYWDIYKPFFMEGIPAESRAEFDKGIKEMQPVIDVVRRCHDGMAVAVTYREGAGFGLTMIGDCGTPEAAVQSTDDVRAFLTKMEAKVTTAEDGTTMLLDVGEGEGEEMFPFAPAWRTSGQYIAMGTHTQWLTPDNSAVPAIQLPEKAHGAQTVMVGNFAFVEPAMKTFSEEVASGSETSELTVMGNAALTGWSASRLADARWAAWGSVMSNGTTEGQGEIRNWPWRDVMKTVADENRKKRATDT